MKIKNHDDFPKLDHRTAPSFWAERDWVIDSPSLPRARPGDRRHDQLGNFQTALLGRITPASTGVAPSATWRSGTWCHCTSTMTVLCFQLSKSVLIAAAKSRFVLTATGPGASVVASSGRRREPTEIGVNAAAALRTAFAVPPKAARAFAFLDRRFQPSTPAALALNRVSA